MFRRSGVFPSLAQQEPPVFIDHFLDLFEISVFQVPETALELEVLPDEVFLGLVIDRVVDTVFHLVEGKDIRLHGHAGDLDGHFRRYPPSRRTTCVDMEEL